MYYYKAYPQILTKSTIRKAAIIKSRSVGLEELRYFYLVKQGRMEEEQEHRRYNHFPQQLEFFMIDD